MDGQNQNVSALDSQTRATYSAPRLINLLDISQDTKTTTPGAPADAVAGYKTGS